MNTKKSILLAQFVLISIINTLAQDTIYSKPEIIEVTIFNENLYTMGNEVNGGSQLNMESVINLNKGINIVVFRNLQYFEGFQISSTNDLEIVSASQYTISDQNGKSKEIEALEKKTGELDKEIDKTKSRISIYTSEREMILANKTVQANGQTDMVESIRKLGDFYRQRIEEIDARIYESNKSLNELTKQLKKITEQIAVVKADKGETSSEIVAQVSSPISGKATFKLSLNDPNSSWMASYDLKVKDVKSPLELHYLATIKQRTGVDWKNVRIKLSSAQPKKGSDCPEIQMWELDYFKDFFEDQPMMDTDEYIKRSKAGFEAFNESTTSFNYELPQPMNIPYNKEPLTVEMTSYKFPAIYEYVCIPSLDPDVFLTAKITDWGKYKLIVGIANLYFEGIYAGDIQIDNGKVTDTLSFSLGRDKGIILERKRIEEYSKKSFLSGKRIENIGWEINILNNKKTDIDLLVKDQLPVPVRKEIEVVQQDISGAEFDKSTGILQWKIQLKPGESKKLLIKYTVSYPKDKKIVIK